MAHSDFLDELHELALGTRLKRLSELMITDAARVYEHFDIDTQPKWFSLLALLHSRNTVSIVEAAELLGLSQPAISQFAGQLHKHGLIEIRTCDSDSRKRLLTLSAKGKEQIAQMQPVWQAVQQAAEQLSKALDNDLYLAIQKFEKALKQKSLLQRTLDIYHDQ